MAGNRNSGRRPKPPSPEDSFSEALLDLGGLIADYTSADDRHHSAQRHRMHEICQRIAGLANGWRDLRGLYPADGDSAVAEVIDLASRRSGGRSPDPSTPNAVAA